MAQTKRQYPLGSNAYTFLNKIGTGVSATVYKAICVPMNSTIVAIKVIDLDQSRSDFDNVRRETKTMSLLSHPNVLNAHCSFTVDRHLWVVMPFMSCGSLQSIVSSAFPNGLPEPCISVFLKETLNAILYLHDQGNLHRDIKAGNILVDSDGSVKLADFGVSTSIYEPISSNSAFGMTSSLLRLTEMAGTPYWMAPEVVHSHTGYSFKADIWSFGITALELAHGRPPLSHLPLLKSLLLKITKRFRFSDYENAGGINGGKKFSKAFKDMVKSCLDQDPTKRPSAEKLLKHSFFKNCKGTDFLIKNVLKGLSSVEERFQDSGIYVKDDDDDEDDDDDGKEIVKHRRISGWNFNADEFKLNPVFPIESESCISEKKRTGELEKDAEERENTDTNGVVGDDFNEDEVKLNQVFLIGSDVKKTGELEIDIDIHANTKGGVVGDYFDKDEFKLNPVFPIESSGKMTDELEIDTDEHENKNTNRGVDDKFIQDELKLNPVFIIGSDEKKTNELETDKDKHENRDTNIGVGDKFNEDEYKSNSVFPIKSDEKKTDELGTDTDERRNKNSDEGVEDHKVILMGIDSEIGCGEYDIDKDLVLEKLMFLKRSLDEQRAKVANLIGALGGEMMSREDQLVLMVEKLRNELEAERKKKRLFVEK